MPVRSTMASIIAKTRQMIFDPEGASQFFDSQTIQDYLDLHRQDRRYEPLEIAPSIVNTASTGNVSSIIFADFYSTEKWWEDDVVLQGYFSGQSWIVLTPVASDNLTGHWTFENNVFTAGTIPGQLPPVFATGKIFDPYASAASLLEFWGAALAGAYDVTVDGQVLRRSQLMTAKLTLAQYYRRQAKPKLAKMIRDDVRPEVSSREVRLLDSDDVYRR